jgi:UDP-N-acetylmuramyl pentapeptide phosphotransferase/UDP-N-acetylglucosamine-1-phosphate transferase
MFGLAGLGITALTLSYLGVAGLRRWAERHEILDIPGERSSHCQPTPRGGGLAIMLVSLLLTSGFVALSATDAVRPWAIFGIASLLVATTGWIDDLFTLSVQLRMAAYGLGAGVIVVGLTPILQVSLPGVGVVTLPSLVGLCLSMLWLVGMTNAYNFMDGIDGLAGSQALVSGIFWAVTGSVRNVPLLIVFGTVLAASSLGFLLHNWWPASIFMGDVGSTFLGFTFGAMPLLAHYLDPNPYYFGTGVLFVALFVFDTGLTLGRRLLHGERIFDAHRAHLYQRLVSRGYSHSQVTLSYTSVATLLSAIGLAYVTLGDPLFASLLTVLALVILTIFFLVVTRLVN